MDKVQQRLYDDLAWVWPIISPHEDYVEEVEQFVRAIQQYAHIPVESLLDLGCGGGHNDHYFQRYFKVTGIDLSEAMLTLARRLNPGVDYQVGDMRTVTVEETFDAVVIADAITYMLDEDNLQAAFANAYRCLKPGGVFCTYAEETKERFEQNSTYSSAHQGMVNDEKVEITLVENYYDPDPTDTTFEMSFVYLIRRAGALQVEIDRHEGGLFPMETWIRLMEKAGFEVHQAPFKGQAFPLLVGVKTIER